MILPWDRYYLHRVCGGGLCKEVSIELRLEGQGFNHIKPLKIWGKNILDKEKSKCKGPEVEMSLSVRSLGLKLEHASELPRGLVKSQVGSLIPGVSVQ